MPGAAKALRTEETAILYYIKEISKLVGISPTTIRYYESKGLLEFKRNEDNKYRTFEESDISMLFRIKALRNRGFTLEQIKTIFLNGTDESAIKQYTDLLNACNKEIDKLNLEKARLKDDIARIEDNSDRYVIRPAMYSIVYLNIERVIMESDLRKSLEKWLEEVPMARTFFRLSRHNSEPVLELGLAVYPGEVDSDKLIHLYGVNYIREYPCMRKKITVTTDKRNESSLRSRIVEALNGEQVNDEPIYGYLLTSNHYSDHSVFSYEVMIPII